MCRRARELPDGSAEPSVADLSRAMRLCVAERGTAAGRARAERARHDMHSKFSRAAVAETVLERLNELSAKKRRLGRKGAAVQGGSREELRLLKEEPATERGAGEAQQRGSRLRGRKKEL